MDQSSIILATLVAYNLVLVFIGYRARRRTHTNEDFFLGGRNLGPVVAAISYSASASSAWTLLGLSGAAFVLGLSAIWIFVGVIASMLFAWYWIAPRLMAESHKHGLVTLTDYLVASPASGSGDASKRAIKILASAIVLISFILYVAAQFQGAGQTFSTTFGLDPDLSIILGGGVIMAYALLGGFWAVSLTDTLQGLVMAFAAVVLPTAALIAVGGISPLMDALEATPLGLSAGNAGLAAIGFVLGSISIGLGTFGQPHLLNRFMALRDHSALVKARPIAIAWYVVVFGGMILLGLCGRILMPDIGNPETLFFALTSSLLPALIAGLLTAAVLSAIMSTADSQLLVAAAAISHDLGISPPGQAGAVLISRLAMAAISVLAMGVAILAPEAIFARVLFAWNAIGAAFGPTIILRLAGFRFGGWTVFSAIAIGFTATVLLSWQPNTPGDIAEKLIPFAAGFLILLMLRKKAVDVGQ